MLRHFFPHGKRWGAWQRFRIPLGGASADMFEYVAADATQFAGEMSCLVSGTWKVRSWSC